MKSKYETYGGTIGRSQIRCYRGRSVSSIDHVMLYWIGFIAAVTGGAILAAVLGLFS